MNTSLRSFHPHEISSHLHFIYFLTQKILDFEISRQKIVEKKSDLCEITLFKKHDKICFTLVFTS